MSFHNPGKIVRFPRNENVDIHVIPATLNDDAPDAEKVAVVEIREFIKSGEVYGHGLVIPLSLVADLKTALSRVEA